MTTINTTAVSAALVISNISKAPYIGDYKAYPQMKTEHNEVVLRLVLRSSDGDLPEPTSYRDKALEERLNISTKAITTLDELGLPKEVRGCVKFTHPVYGECLLSWEAMLEVKPELMATRTEKCGGPTSHNLMTRSIARHRSERGEHWGAHLVDPRPWAHCNFLRDEENRWVNRIWKWLYYGFDLSTLEVWENNGPDDNWVIVPPTDGGYYHMVGPSEGDWVFHPVIEGLLEPKIQHNTEPYEVYRMTDTYMVSELLREDRYEELLAEIVTRVILANLKPE